MFERDDNEEEMQCCTLAVNLKQIAVSLMKLASHSEGSEHVDLPSSRVHTPLLPYMQRMSQK